MTTEQLLISAADAKEIKNERVLVSPDGKRTAYVKSEGKAERLVVDGVAGKAYEHVFTGNLQRQNVFFDGGKRVAYVGVTDKQYLMVVDGEEIDLGGLIQVDKVYVDPNQRSWACVVLCPDGIWLVIDGKRVHKVWLPDYVLYFAGHWLLVEQDETTKQYHAVFDGKREKGYRFIDKKSLVIQGSGAYAYVGITDFKDGKYHFVVNGRESRAYDVIFADFGFTLGPGGKRIAFTASRSKQSYLVVDDEEVSLPGSAWDPIFSPDGKHWACVVSKDSRYSIWKDGKQIGGDYEFISVFGGSSETKSLVFSPDWSRLGFVASDQKAKKYFAVIDGVEQPRYDEVRRVAFSPDGTRVAYTASRGGKQFVVADGKEGTEYDKVEGGTVGFGTDGSHLAYIARTAKEGNAGVLVIDGRERTRYEKMLPGSNNTLHYADGAYAYVAVRDGAYYWVEERRKE